jgi:hypothetical protein
MVSNHPKRTFARLRYFLGGDRPSQTTHQTLSPHLIQGGGLESQRSKGGIPLVPFGSHLFSTCYVEIQYQAVVKLHGVFPSSSGKPVSSPALQFHRVSRRDSAQIVTPFVRVGTYPTRNFATLGPL